VLDPLFASLTLDTLQRLNEKIAVVGEQPAEVAQSYLKNRRFLP
jgi:glycine betaine/choline ABC-type transport system substrate-binding protein